MKISNDTAQLRVKISKRNDTAQLAIKVSLASCPSETSSTFRSLPSAGRESPRLGARTSEERPEERREEQQVRDVSDNSHRPSVEPVARGGSPRGIPRGRRRRAPSPRSGRCARISHPEDCEPRAVGPIDVLTPRRAAFHLREATRYSSSRSRCRSSRTESEFCARAPGSACQLNKIALSW